MFLLYSPLNQGLKPSSVVTILFSLFVFTLQSIKSRIETGKRLRQSLQREKVFTLQSIKSRIETWARDGWAFPAFVFLLYSPLNQGLKLTAHRIPRKIGNVFTLQSIKSRIETSISLPP